MKRRPPLPLSQSKQAFVTDIKYLGAGALDLIIMAYSKCRSIVHYVQRPLSLIFVTT